MTQRKVSHLGIVFFTPEELIQSIKTIEGICPGWWWSIAQTHNFTRLSLGPGQNCPLVNDQKLAATKEGDDGYHFQYPVSSIGDDTKLSVEDFIRDSLLSMNVARGMDPAMTTVGVDLMLDTWMAHFRGSPAPTKVRRKQGEEDLTNLSRIYTRFLETDCDYIEHHGYHLTQLYLGSCDLTTDCSLRGDRKDNSEFDTTVDLYDDGTIAQSLDQAVTEIEIEFEV